MDTLGGHYSVYNKVGLSQFFKDVSLFIFGCTGSCVLCPSPSLGVGSRGHSSAEASLVAEHSFLGAAGSVILAQSPCGMWNLPKPGVKHVSPALTDGLLTTGPAGKSVS